jgi:hypothetical protein
MASSSTAAIKSHEPEPSRNASSQGHALQMRNQVALEEESNFVVENIVPLTSSTRGYNILQMLAERCRSILAQEPRREILALQLMCHCTNSYTRSKIVENTPLLNNLNSMAMSKYGYSTAFITHRLVPVGHSLAVAGQAEKLKETAVCCEAFGIPPQECDSTLTREIAREKLKTLYKTMALKTHPDKGGDADEFKTLSRCYDTYTKTPAQETGHVFRLLVLAGNNAYTNNVLAELDVCRECLHSLHAQLVAQSIACGCSPDVFAGRTHLGTAKEVAATVARRTKDVAADAAATGVGGTAGTISAAGSGSLAWAMGMSAWNPVILVPIVAGYALGASMGSKLTSLITKGNSAGGFTVGLIGFIAPPAVHEELTQMLRKKINTFALL